MNQAVNSKQAAHASKAQNAVGQASSFKQGTTASQSQNAVDQASSSKQDASASQAPQQPRTFVKREDFKATKVTTESELGETLRLTASLLSGKQSLEDLIGSPKKIDPFGFFTASFDEQDRLWSFIRQIAYQMDEIMRQRYNSNLCSNRKKNMQTLSKTHLVRFPHSVAVEHGYFDKENCKDNPLNHSSSYFGSELNKFRWFLAIKYDSFDVTGVWIYTHRGDVEKLNEELRKKQIRIMSLEEWLSLNEKGTPLPDNIVFTVFNNDTEVRYISTDVTTISLSTPMEGGEGMVMDQSMEMLYNKVIAEEYRKLAERVRPSGPMTKDLFTTCRKDLEYLAPPPLTSANVTPRRNEGRLARPSLDGANSPPLPSSTSAPPTGPRYPQINQGGRPTGFGALNRQQGPTSPTYNTSGRQYGGYGQTNSGYGSGAQNGYEYGYPGPSAGTGSGARSQNGFQGNYQTGRPGRDGPVDRTIEQGEGGDKRKRAEEFDGRNKRARTDRLPASVSGAANPTRSYGGPATAQGRSGATSAFAKTGIDANGEPVFETRRGRGPSKDDELS